MSAPYFCTKCARQHLRGKIYDEHMAYIKAGLPPVEEAKVKQIIMEIETPTKAEILAAVDAACQEAAIPEDIQVLPKLTKVVVDAAHPMGTVVSLRDGADNEVRPPQYPGPTVGSGETITPNSKHNLKRHREHWWQFWRPVKH
jgi:hypothetical protein